MLWVYGGETMSIDWRTLLARYGTALAALGLFLFFAVAARNFLAPGNLIGIAKHISHIAILGIGFSLALIASELDLSFANVCSLAAVATGLLVHRGYPPALAVAAGLGVGVAFGLANGAIVTLLKVPSLIATLAMAAIASGCAFLLTEGVSVVGRWPTSFTALGRGTLLGLPALVWWMALVAGVSAAFLRHTRTGFRLICTGESVHAARLAGLPVRRLKVLGLALSGGLAGLAAVLLTASLSSAAPNMAGDFLLTAIAAVTLGMTMFRPGHANVAGTLVGALTIGMLGNGLVLLGAPYYVQDICLGLIIIGSVAVSASGLTRAAFEV
jgi:ribose transport system permease protein